MVICPCILIEPCRGSCTCKNSFYSGGCERCASYGSLEQQIAQAKFIANAINEYKLKPGEMLVINIE